MTCLNWWDGVLPVLDFEATGTDPQEDRIVSVALVLCTPRGRTLPGGVVTLVNPGVPIPQEASAVHGITDDMVQDKPTTAEVLPELLRCLMGIQALGWPLVIYNATYDWPLLNAEAARHGGPAVPEVPIIDPLVLDRGYDRFRPGGRKLGDVCWHYGVELVDAHDALSDALATAELCRAIVSRYPELQQMDFRALHDLQADMHAAWLREFNRYRAQQGREPIPEVHWPGMTEVPCSR